MSTAQPVIPGWCTVGDEPALIGRPGLESRRQRPDEVAWQLRDQAGERQVEGARVGLTINQGLFGHGSCVILSR